MEMKKILWPTDLSENAAWALPVVTAVSERFQTEVHVLYVIEELALHESWYGEFDRSHIDKIHQWEKDAAAKRLEKICEEHLYGCPLYVRHVAVGDPAREILKLADQEKVDMVIMATHGRKGHFDFGSVAEKVIKHAPVPVITVPASKEV